VKFWAKTGALCRKGMLSEEAEEVLSSSATDPSCREVRTLGAHIVVDLLMTRSHQALLQNDPCAFVLRQQDQGSVSVRA
jgi:hypothetical protein